MGIILLDREGRGGIILFDREGVGVIWVLFGEYSLNSVSFQGVNLPGADRIQKPLADIRKTVSAKVLPKVNPVLPSASLLSL